MASPTHPTRIASLLPSATEIVYALGRGDDLVAVTHECDYPPDASSKTAVTSSMLPSGLPSAAIDRAVREGIRDAHTIYALDTQRLVDLAPDVVITQSLCDVCAVPRATVEDAVCTMPEATRVVSLDPHTVDGVLDSIIAAGDALGVPDRAADLVASLRGRIETVREAVGGADRPRVLCVEWLDPIFRGGHWVPEQAEIAGGVDGLGRPGEPSAVVAWEEVVDYAPEVIVLMPCGFDENEAGARLMELSARPGWERTPAVRHERVFAVDGSAYFSRPGPRLVDGIELLAAVLHSNEVETPPAAGYALQLRASGFERYPK